MNIKTKAGQTTATFELKDSHDNQGPLDLVCGVWGDGPTKVRRPIAELTVSVWQALKGEATSTT